MQDAAAEQRLPRLSIGVTIATTVGAIRREIAEASEAAGPQRGLAIDFTAAPRWRQTGLTSSRKNPM